MSLPKKKNHHTLLWANPQLFGIPWSRPKSLFYTRRHKRIILRRSAVSIKFIMLANVLYLRIYPIGWVGFFLLLHLKCLLLSSAFFCVCHFVILRWGCTGTVKMGTMCSIRKWNALNGEVGVWEDENRVSQCVFYCALLGWCHFWSSWHQLTRRRLMFSQKFHSSPKLSFAKIHIFCPFLAKKNHSSTQKLQKKALFHFFIPSHCPRQIKNFWRKFLHLYSCRFFL